VEIPINQDLIEICKNIIEENNTEEEWAETESGDMFQTPMFCGGFDADENLFWFSYFAPKDKEYWFSFSLETANKIANKESCTLLGSIAD
jgi:hypothetical protein